MNIINGSSTQAQLRIVCGCSCYSERTCIISMQKHFRFPYRHVHRQTLIHTPLLLLETLSGLLVYYFYNRSFPEELTT